MPIDRFYEPRGAGHIVPSNFYEGPGFDAPAYDGGPVRHWPSVEHYYQAAKADNAKDSEYIRSAPTPGTAKKAGRATKLRLGWDTIKLDVMRRALAYKFAPGTNEAGWLMSTDRYILIEGNNWNDRFWGCVKNSDDEWVGENWLGWMLMAQRAYLHALDWNDSGLGWAP